MDVAARPHYRLWLRYDDGTEGEIDLSGLVGQGVFAAWRDETVFAGVSLGPHGEIFWNEDIDLCPDALYLELTGKAPEDLFPKLQASCWRSPTFAPPPTP